MWRLLHSPKRSWWWFRAGGGSGDEGERIELRCSSQVKVIEFIDGLDGEKEIYYIYLILFTFKWGLTMSRGLARLAFNRGYISASVPHAQFRFLLFLLD